MGLAAAKNVAAIIQQACKERGEARVIFACAPSQDDFFAALTDEFKLGSHIDWSKVVAFHMDDYVGLSGKQSQSFRYYLNEHLLSKVQVKAFHPVRAEAPDTSEECARYTKQLSKLPLDLVCMGIGENGHIAFNDPPVADFKDPKWIKVVELDLACRQQQVNDGCFASLEAVPTHAFTLTIPTLLSCKHISCVVPGALKAQAVANTLQSEITTDCPATILRTHANVQMFIDNDSAQVLQTSASNS